jgi:cellulose synthase/poly-beta-1,6-N-acetylglucosamine synthase-like glycosyltransferase
MHQILLIIFTSVFIFYALFILYYRAAWKLLPPFKASKTKLPSTTISVIIPARNEAANIKACLDSLMRQAYPKNLFEIIVIDDFSTDNTGALVSAYATQNVKLISLKDFASEDELNSFKKKAIEIAINQATGNLIVCTDADCTSPENWLQTIAAFYEEKQAAFIAMPVSINCNNRFIEIFQSLDFMTLQGITGASVYKKIHSMCNGANLAYPKQAFIEVGGFTGVDTIASGDDMLLMHKIYKHYPNKIFFLKSPQVIVQTQPVSSVAAFFKQRIRWASKADKYDDKRIFAVLLLVYLCNLMLIAIPVIVLFINPEFNFQIYPLTINFTLLELWLFIIISKTVIELFFLYPVAKFFNKQNLLWWFPVMQPLHILYTVIAGWLGKFASYKWKGRQVK